MTGVSGTVPAPLAGTGPAAYKAAMTAFLKMHGLGNDFAVFDARKRDVAFDAALRKGRGRPQDRHRLRSGDRDRAGRRRAAPTPACASSMPMAARSKAAAMPRAASPGSLMDEKDASARPHRHARRAARMPRRRRRATSPWIWAMPHLDWDEIPLARPADTNGFALNIDGTEHFASAVSVGNPHCILFVDDAEAAAVAELGPRIEHHPMFPARVNVEFVQRAVAHCASHARVGARRRHHAGLRHRGLRGRHRRPSPRSRRAQGRGRARRRHARNRMARKRQPRR